MVPIFKVDRSTSRLDLVYRLAVHLMTPFLKRRLEDEAETVALGTKLALRLKAGDMVALSGDLGAGKTTFARGLIRTFVGRQIDVPSPTFTLVQTYTNADESKISNPDTQSPLDLFHFDLYRLKNSEEVWELGWEDIANGIAIVEWPDKAGDNLPDTRLNIALSFDQGGRVAYFSARNEDFWKDRLHGV
jgi:tRNA threonylcarbamoyladenosine biosynthesis protein TsaE